MPKNPTDVSRRSVLKTAAGVAGGAGGIGTVTGFAAADPTPEVAILQTERFRDAYSRPIGRASDVVNYCSNTWRQYLDGTLFVSLRTSPVIPEDELGVPSGYEQRPGQVESWLQGDLSTQDRRTEHVVFDQYDAFLVLDHIPDSAENMEGNSPGYTVFGGEAGADQNKTAAVNTWYDQTGYDDDEFAPLERVGLEGAAFHELLHLFDGDHADAEGMGDRASLLFAPGATLGCNGSVDASDVEEVGHWVSPCNIGSVNDFLGDNGF